MCFVTLQCNQSITLHIGQRRRYFLPMQVLSRETHYFFRYSCISLQASVIIALFFFPGIIQSCYLLKHGRMIPIYIYLPSHSILPAYKDQVCGRLKVRDNLNIFSHVYGTFCHQSSNCPEKNDWFLSFFYPWPSFSPKALFLTYSSRITGPNLFKLQQSCTLQKPC